MKLGLAHWHKMLSTMTLATIPLCDEKLYLMEEFLAAASDLVSVHNDQVNAVIGGDPDFSRFDLLIHLANERKLRAKYAYMTHLETHGC
jgi:hypothetical protein